MNRVFCIGLPLLLCACYEHQAVDPFDASSDVLPDRSVPDLGIPDRSVNETGNDTPLNQCNDAVPPGERASCTSLAACRDRCAGADEACTARCFDSAPNCGACVSRLFLECAIARCPAETGALRCCLADACDQPNDLVGACATNSCQEERRAMDACLAPQNCFQRDPVCF